ncbi:transposable element Tcb2 transposase [Trichonephila clavipes]|nr:transposable element Tcb2 transposase [Trichonephila clavipes]
MGNPIDEKRRSSYVLSDSHGSVTTARLEDRALAMFPDRPRALRGRQTRDQRNKRDHRDWSINQWATVLFSNESRFSLTSDSCRSFIRRETGTHYLLRCRYRYCRLPEKPTIRAVVHTHHVFERDFMADVRYRDEVLELYVCLFSLDGMASQVSRYHPYRACLGHSEEGNCNSEPLSEDHPRTEIKVVERVGLISPGTDKFSYFL